MIPGFLVFDDDARRQLVALLDHLPRLARANGEQPSALLLDLRASLSRSRPQHVLHPDRRPLDPHAGEVQRLLHPYDEAAQMLGGLSVDGVQRLVKSGALCAVAVGKRRMIPHEALLSYVESLSADAAAASASGPSTPLSEAS